MHINKKINQIIFNKLYESGRGDVPWDTDDPDTMPHLAPKPKPIVYDDSDYQFGQGPKPPKAWDRFYWDPVLGRYVWGDHLSPWPSWRRPPVPVVNKPERPRPISWDPRRPPMNPRQ